MNNCIRFGILWLSLLTTACEVVQHTRLQAPARHQLGEATQVIPFHYAQDIVIVEARLHDQDTTHAFIFDTGAFTGKLEWGLAESLGLETHFLHENSTAAGISREVPMIRINSLHLGEAPFLEIAAGKLRFDSSSYSPCLGPAGIIGSNLIKLANWRIDYAQRQLVVSTQTLRPAAGVSAHTIPFSTSLLSGVPELELTIAEIKIPEVILDVGYNGGLVLPLTYAAYFSQAPSQMIIDQSTSGIFGSKRDTLIVKELPVTLAGLTTTMPVAFSAQGKSLLGNDFLEHFRVYLNYTNEQLTLESTEPIDIATVRPFVPGILNDSLWVVTRTTPQLPLRIGDTLQTVNHFLPCELFSSHCAYFWGLDALLAPDTCWVQKIDGELVQIIKE